MGQQVTPPARIHQVTPALPVSFQPPQSPALQIHQPEDLPQVTLQHIHRVTPALPVSFQQPQSPPTPNSLTRGPSSGNSTTHSSGNSSTSSFLSTTAEPSSPMSAATSRHARLMLVFATFVMPLGYL